MLVWMMSFEKYKTKLAFFIYINILSLFYALVFLLHILFNLKWFQHNYTTLITLKMYEKYLWNAKNYDSHLHTTNNT